MKLELGNQQFLAGIMIFSSSRCESRHIIIYLQQSLYNDPLSNLNCIELQSILDKL